ncbi:MAG: LPS export ABC transporter permease LptG [Dongiaceae bacterium]
MGRFMSPTLSLYIARQVLLWFLVVYAALLGIIFLAETVELLRRAAGHETIGLARVLQMAAFKTPYTAQEVLPFAMLASAMGAYRQMTRFNELVVARASGVSVWQFLMPALVVAAAIGGVRVLAIDTVAAATAARADRLEALYFRRQPSLLAAPANGLWLRQKEAQGEAVLHAGRVAPEEMTLYQVTILSFTEADRFAGRIDARAARLENGYWQLDGARFTRPNAAGSYAETYQLATDLSFERIADGFAPPHTVSFWRLPRYIERLEATGFAARGHRIQWHRLLATPLLLAAMVLLAAVFSLRPPRRGGTAWLVGAGGLTGFLLYFVSDIVLNLGRSASLPLELAAWTPAGVSTMLGVAMLLHLEDG